MKFQYKKIGAGFLRPVVSKVPIFVQNIVFPKRL